MFNDFWSVIFFFSSQFCLVASYLSWVFSTLLKVIHKCVHKLIGDPLLCPKAALIHQVIHIWSHRGPPPPQYPTSWLWWVGGKYITPTMIFKTLKTSVGFCRPNLGFEAKEMSVFSLCNTGAMTLLWSWFYINFIKLIGRWRSKKMLRFPHVQT